MKRAGLEDHWDYMKNLTNRRINNNEYFPGSVKAEIDGDPRTMGLSSPNPMSPNYGITLQEDLSTKEIGETLMHELSHWATGNAGINDRANFARHAFANDPKTEYIGDIMRYNESLSPNIPWEEILNEMPKSTPLSAVDQKLKDYEYLIQPTEKRARAMAIYQQAKEAGMSTDAFIDSFVRDGRISDTAPNNLRQLGDILTIDNLKKYLRNFLSVTAPIELEVSVDGKTK